MLKAIRTLAWIKRNLLRRPDALNLHDRMVGLEVLTDDPARARFAVMQVDGHVRLVAEHLYLRPADIVHPRGTAAFDQFIRYWRIERSENEVRANSGDTLVVREYLQDPLTELARTIGQRNSTLADIPGVRRVVAGPNGFTPGARRAT